MTRNSIKLSENTFPYDVRHRDVTGHLTLYAEKGRTRATYRFYGPTGDRTKKQPVPKELGPAAIYPDPVTIIQETGEEREVIYVPELVI
jgi:hypothetical protein